MVHLKDGEILCGRNPHTEEEAGCGTWVDSCLVKFNEFFRFFWSQLRKWDYEFITLLQRMQTTLNSG